MISWDLNKELVIRWDFNKHRDDCWDLKKENCDSMGFVPEKKNYFTSSDPHHGIQFIPSDNLSGISIGHSIWHVF